MLILLKLVVFSAWLILIKQIFEINICLKNKDLPIFTKIYGLDPNTRAGNLFIVSLSLVFALILALIEFL